jgi:acylphosphatase
MSETRLEATVHGMVQGVGYRMFALDAARRLGLTGWVANERGGMVRVVAEGHRVELERLLADLERGPVAAFVERVVVAWMPATGEFAGFAIRSSWHGGD